MVATRPAIGRRAITASGARHAIDALERNGVDTVFGIPGVHTLALYDALYSSKIRHVLARHEQGAGFMADGYARATGKPGVAIVITGPGVTNIATPVGEAYTDSSPMLVLSSNVERAYLDSMRGSLHDLKDQMGVMAAVTQWNTRVLNAGEVSDAVDSAFRRLNTGRSRPVHVELPLDVLDEIAETTPKPVKIEVEKPAAEWSAIERAADALAAADRPLIYCGGGVASSGASGVVLEIAELLGSPVMTSIMGKGSIPEDHPLSLGVLWQPGNEIDQIVRDSDCALVIGSKLGAQATEDFQLELPASLIRVEIDHTEMFLNAGPNLPLLGDARVVSEQMLNVLRDLRESHWTNRTAEAEQARAAAERSAYRAERRSHVDALRRAIPRDGILTADMTMMSYVASYLYPAYEPGTFLYPSGYGTLGFSLPVAIGAKIGRPEKPVVAMIGDGGFQYTMAELGCAVQERLSLPVVIFNDSTYTAVKAAQEQSRGGRYIAVDLVNPDYVELARAYGIPGVRANSPEDMEREIVSAFDQDLPTIIDVPIEPWV
jgi:thiamine pyrophosphate-dependent acetolactate synthase large subunit-like protein